LSGALGVGWLSTWFGRCPLMADAIGRLVIG
jgi:hypothetical protein